VVLSLISLPSCWLKTGQDIKDDKDKIKSGFYPKNPKHPVGFDLKSLDRFAKGGHPSGRVLIKY
jgi:hypothetical protein